MDLKYLLFLQNIRQSLPYWVEKFFALISAIDINPLLYLIPFVIYWSVDKRKGQRFLTAIWLGSIVNSMAKLSVCCYRPWIRSEAIQPSPLAIPGATGYSFPSGHSTSAMTMFGSLGWLYRKQSRAFFAFCCAVIALVMFSRNYLGVHTPQDVIFGAAAGVLTIFLSIKFCDWAEENRDKDAQVLLMALGIVALVFVYYAFKNYPRDYKADGSLLVDPKRMMRSGIRDCGYVTALAVSWFIERRFINFSTDVSIGERVCRAIIGCAFMGLCFFVLLPPLIRPMGYYPHNFVRGLMTVFPGALIAPLAFKPLHALFEKKANDGQA